MVGINPRLSAQNLSLTKKVDAKPVDEQGTEAQDKAKQQPKGQAVGLENTTLQPKISVPLEYMQFNAGVLVNTEKELPEAEAKRTKRIRPEQLPEALNPDKPYRVGDVIKVKDKDSGFVVMYTVVAVKKDFQGEYSYEYEVSFKN